MCLFSPQKVSQDKIFELVKREYTYVESEKLGKWHKDAQKQLEVRLIKKGQLVGGLKIQGEIILYQALLEKVLKKIISLIKRYNIRYENEINEDNRASYSDFLNECFNIPTQIDPKCADNARLHIKNKAQHVFDVAVYDINYTIQTNNAKDRELKRTSLWSGVYASILTLIFTGLGYLLYFNTLN